MKMWKPSVRTIIPVGKSLGPYMESGELKYHEIDLGPGLEELEIYQYMMWALAHDNPDAQLERRLDRKTLKADYEKHNDTRSNDDMERDINALIEKRAFVEIDLKNDDLEAFLSSYAFMPLGRCHGNVGDDPELYGIGHAEPHLWVPKWTQMIWSSSHRFGAVWNSCVEIANGIDGVTPEVVARNFVESLPALIAIHCGYLEVL